MSKINTYWRRLRYILLCKLLSNGALFNSKLYHVIVSNYRRPIIQGIEQNLVNLGFSIQDSALIARQESQASLIRDVYSHWYEIANQSLLAAYLDRLVLQDEHSDLRLALQDQTSIIAVLHVGHYWESVAKIVRLSNGKVKFIIPILSLDNLHAKRSILSLKPFCRDLIVVDISQRKSAITQIVKCIKRGYKLIIFPDLPPSIGSQFFGDPAYGRFLHKPASIASGAIGLARLFKLDMVYVSSTPKHQGDNQVVFVERVKYYDVSVNKNFAVMQSVIREHPQHWAYLDRVENYFQHQLSEAELKQKWNL